MKVAPVLRALDARKGFRSVLVHTGQHYDAHMSDAFFRDLGIRPPDANLGRRPELWDGATSERVADVLTAWRDGAPSPWPGAAAGLATGGAWGR